MPPPFEIPQDVQDWLSGVFRGCSERTAGKMSRLANLWETSLDLTFVEHFSQYSAPFAFASDYVVRIDTHYLGGGRHFGEWEIADIGILVLFRSAGRVVRSKIGLLQSKRLYPLETREQEDHLDNYLRGFGRLFETTEAFSKAAGARTFEFAQESRYEALHVGAQQYQSILEYEQSFQIPVYYALYNPWIIPWAVQIPASAGQDPTGECKVGMRIIPAHHLASLMSSKAEGYRPSYADLLKLGPPFDTDETQGGWRLEDFVVKKLLDCSEGYIANQPLGEDPGLFRVFNRRSGPISAAIQLTIEAPPMVAGE